MSKYINVSKSGGKLKTDESILNNPLNSLEIKPNKQLQENRIKNINLSSLVDSNYVIGDNIFTLFLKYYNTFSKEQILDVLNRFHSSIFSDKLKKNENMEILYNCFIDNKFIDLFYQFINTHPYINQEERRYMNRCILYAYKNHNNLLIKDIAYILNQFDINNLSGKILDRDFVIYITLINNINSDTYISIIEVYKSIIEYTRNLSEQEIIYILEEFFSNNLQLLFSNLITNSYYLNNINQNNYYKLYHAVFLIINDMPNDIISNLFRTYNDNRFLLNCISLQEIYIPEDCERANYIRYILCS